MKTIVLYNSKTGFTQKYANWIAQELQCEAKNIKDKKQKIDLQSYDTIIFGSNIKANRIGSLDYLRKNILPLNKKKAVLFAVGLTGAEEKAAKELFKENLSSEEIGKLKTFYFEGGLSYEKMNFFEKKLLKMLGKSMINKEGATQEEKEKGKAMMSSFDLSKKESIAPLVEYVKA